jgi:hypothetical protein
MHRSALCRTQFTALAHQLDALPHRRATVLITHPLTQVVLT